MSFKGCIYLMHGCITSLVIFILHNLFEVLNELTFESDIIFVRFFGRKSLTKIFIWFLKALSLKYIKENFIYNLNNRFKCFRESKLKSSKDND